MIKNRVVSNAAWIIVCRVIQSLLSLVIGMLTARYLGPAKYGLINYAASLTAFFLPFMQLGLNSILVQEIINAYERADTKAQISKPAREYHGKYQRKK